MPALARALAALLVLSPLALAGCERSVPPAEPGEADYLARCDLPGGLAAYCRACAGGSAGACIAVALAYERGEELARDDLGMVAFERRACELGSGRGCANLGSSYLSGRSVPRNLARGETLYERGCGLSERKCDAEGLAYECVSAARCRLGDEEAIEPRHVALAETACDGGDRLGCTVALTAATRAPDPDASKVAALLARGCRTGSPRHCEELAAHLWLGLGVDPDPDAARATFAGLCEQGRSDSCHAARGYMPFATLLPFLTGATWSYPRDAINAGRAQSREPRAGKVTVGFCVAPDGAARETVILAGSGNEDVDDGAAKGVRTWRFPQRPAITREPLCLQVTFCDDRRCE